MSIYVVRHGQTDWNIKNIYQGQTDIALNNTGRIQAQEVANNIENLNLEIDLIISSPLSRAIETADIINKKLNVRIKQDDRIVERYNGSLEGARKEEKERQFINKQMFDLDLNYSEYNIETIKDMFKRIYNFLDETLEKNKDKNILIVTHSGVAIIIHCYFRGIPKDKNLMNLVMKNCELRKYERKK